MMSKSLFMFKRIATGLASARAVTTQQNLKLNCFADAECKTTDYSEAYPVCALPCHASSASRLAQPAMINQSADADASANATAIRLINYAGADSTRTGRAAARFWPGQ
jgi:hypothetical protein